MRPVPSSKISIPELPADLVHRTELLRQLDSAADVALVSAPAGYGKTMLVAEWSRASTDVDTAWVRLDEDDNDQRRLWSAVLASVARAHTASADGPRPAGFDVEDWDMGSAGRPDFLAKLIEGLSALPRPLRLVLDDLHEVTDAATLHGLQSFLRDRPPNVVLVLVSRLDPPFHLHRLRVEGGLTELRSNRLQFDRVESEALLRRAGLALTARQVDQLYQQTDGWPAGLRLAAAAAAMDATTDVDRFLAEFSGDERSVADYLVGEVFSSLPADRMQLLQATSICKSLPVGLAVVLSDREDAGWLLADLEHRTALVREIGHNRGVYRVQPLVRSHLLADLNRQSVQRIARLHTIAACWWRDWGHPAEALEHAALSGEPALLTDLARDVAVSQLVVGEHRPLRRALAASGELSSAPIRGCPSWRPWSATRQATPTPPRSPGRHACRTWPPNRRYASPSCRAVAEELGVLPQTAGAACASLPEEDAVPAEPSWRHSFAWPAAPGGCVPATIRSTCVVRSTGCGPMPTAQASSTCPCSVSAWPPSRRRLVATCGPCAARRGGRGGRGHPQLAGLAVVVDRHRTAGLRQVARRRTAGGGAAGHRRPRPRRQGRAAAAVRARGDRGRRPRGPRRPGRRRRRHGAGAHGARRRVREPLRAGCTGGGGVPGFGPARTARGGAHGAELVRRSRR
jgi:LuxR family maltose regulon positive regulatory protein